MYLSLSSPDETVAPGDASLVQDDYRAYQGLLKRIAASLDIPVEIVQESPHRLVNILGLAGHSRVALPINEAIL